MATIENAIYEATEKGSEAILKDKLQEAFKDLTVGDKVEIYSMGHRKDSDDKIGATESLVEKYSNDDLVANVDTTVSSIQTAIKAGTNTNLAFHTDSVVKDTANSTIKIYLNPDINMNLPTENKKINNETKDWKLLTISEGDEKLDFTKVETRAGKIFDIDANTPAAKGTTLDSSKKCTIDQVIGFPKATSDEQDLPGELIETIKITGTQYNYKTEDLYDGLMLTTEGHDFLSLIKKSDKKAKYAVRFRNLRNELITSTPAALPTLNGEYGFRVEIEDAYGKINVYTIKGEEKSTLTLAKWLYGRLAKVDILAGANRYATAVQIAKEQASIEPFGEGVLGDIVLVNGKALVDGLSAAPLASIKNAPVLLTAADALPKETKAYIKELLHEKSQADLEAADKAVTVHLVGGRTVLSTAVENELKDMGLKIKRYNGDNREETSLKVADYIESESKATDKRFVVGAEGEADAMSIAGVASTKDVSGKVSPIIVSKKGGLTDDALEVLTEKTITVLGGEKSVSAEDYEALEENVGKNGAVRRIAGENRQATNAAIIKTFYHTDGIVNGKVESVVVAKDGRGNRDELVDALTAANLAVQKNAPIVLAKSSLSAEQMEALNLRAKSSESLYQVGEGVERSVMETLAKALGLSNLK